VNLIGGRSKLAVNGKGSARRPSTVDGEKFSSNWDKAFGDKKMRVELSRHFHKEEPIEAIVCLTDDGFLVEIYEKERHVKTSESFSREIHADNYAENVCLLGVDF
jgi:hypothetical protein